jgi:hypothetical protein
VSKLRRFFALSGRDRHLLLYVLFVTGMTCAALVVVPFHRWRNWLQRLTRRRRPLPLADQPAVERVKWAVEAAARAVPGGTCLSAALTGQSLLQHYGYSADLHVGVCVRPGHQLEAHAWVEREGQVVIGDTGDLDSYHTLLPSEDPES